MENQAKRRRFRRRPPIARVVTFPAPDFALNAPRSIVRLEEEILAEMEYLEPDPDPDFRPRLFPTSIVIDLLH